MRLSGHVEVEGDLPARARGGLQRSKSVVRRLAALFALDAFAGGFIVQSFMVFWFGRQFGADAQLMGLVFFVVGLLQAASSVIAGWLAARIGMLNTMVFSHLPSNVLLALIPFAPSLAVAGRCCCSHARRSLRWTFRPARRTWRRWSTQPNGRRRRATRTRRGTSCGPRARSWHPSSMGMAAGLPFLIAGGLKAVYDVALYFTFRRVRLAEDDPASTRPA